MVCMRFFFFLKQKTAYEMRISDWSSDVCYSDLKLVLCQLEDVGGRLEETVPKEALDMDDAQTFDVERVARHEMPQPFDPLRRADKAAGAAYVDLALLAHRVGVRSEEHTSELQAIMRLSYAVFCLQQTKTRHTTH